MIKHIWTIPCSLSIVDQRSNNVSLLEILERITVAGPPLDEGQQGAVPMRFQVVTLWGRARDSQPARGYGRLLFVSPSGSIIGGPEYDVDLSIYEQFRMFVQFTELPVREAGYHQFVVELRDEGETEWREVARIPLQILFEPSQEQDNGG